MKIAIMIPELTGGGAQRAAQVLGDYLIDQGHEVFYFLLDSISPRAYKVNGKIVYINISRYREDIFRGDDHLFWRGIKQAGTIIKKVKKECKIDVSISFMEECNFLNVVSSVGEKIIVSIRTTLSEREEMKGFLYNKDNIRKIYNRADWIVAVSEYVKKDLEDNYGLCVKKLIAIPNAAMRHNDINKNQNEWPYGNKAILSVARINPEKQHDHIIKAFRYVHEQFKDSVLIILGVGHLEDYMKWYSRINGVEEYVHFIGFEEDIGYYMSNSRVFVMASKAEGFPNSMVEAMSYGMPVVTTNSPGGCREIAADDINSIVDNVCYEKYGIMVPYIKGKARPDHDYPEDEYLAEALKRVLADEELYEKYSARSLERASYYSYDKVMEKWTNIIGR